MKPLWMLVVCGLAGYAGCTGPALRSQSPEEIEAAGEGARLVGELAVPHQMQALTIEAVGLVTRLDGTGSDPGPSPQRMRLLEEMRTLNVNDPNTVLASPNTEMVLLRAYLRPGIQKGDRLDVEIRVPSQSEATSLRGGWLLDTRMQQLAVLGNEVREGKVLAMARGPLLIDPPTGGEGDRVRENRGRILGGGVSLTTRPLALVAKPNFQGVHYTTQVGAAINRRFHTFVNGKQEGVAHPKDDKYIELTVHPRYKDNIDRYMRVVRSVALKENVSQRQRRIERLERQLLDPVTSATAALRLEAVGRDALPSLRKGAQSADLEVRFYAAEALAYLDDSAAAVPLGEAARNEPAFRPYALAALSAMDDMGAYDQLRTLLDSVSAETRYGAFRSLWAMDSKDSFIRGELFDDGFGYHVLPTTGPDMIHATRSYRPELVLFGPQQTFVTPLMLEAGPKILVTCRDGEQQVTVSRFAVGEPDQKRIVSAKVDDVIRAVVDVGGTYPDVVQLLQQAKECRCLPARFEVDALPAAGRVYRRSETAADAAAETDAGDASPEAPAEDSQGFEMDNPLPDLFSRRTAKEGDETEAELSNADEEDYSSHEYLPGLEEANDSGEEASTVPPAASLGPPEDAASPADSLPTEIAPQAE